jgi:DNA repair exonuclease SbcCD ATPase subunit
MLMRTTVSGRAAMWAR